MMLEQEISYYQSHLNEWLSKYPGKIVVIKGEELIGVYDDQDNALAEGARRFGLSSFLVRPVQAQQEEFRIPALTLGLLNADPARPTLW